MSLITFKFPKAANLSEISSHIKFLCCLFTYCHHQIVISITVSSPEISYIEHTPMPSPVYQYVIILVVSSHQDKFQVYLWMFCWGKTMVVTTRFFDVAKFTIITPLTLLFWCRLCLPTVGSKISCPPSFALNLLTAFSYGTWKNCKKKPTLIPHKNCLLNHPFSHHLVHAQNNYFTPPGNSQNCMTSYH
jgi:hypothetical protein